MEILQRAFVPVFSAVLLLTVSCGGPGGATATGPPPATTPSTAPAVPSATPPSAATAPGAQAPARSDLPPDLLAQATVAVEQARRTALERVPGARITSEELEREGGRLIYTFELTTPGRSGIDEVNVDAHDGSRVSVQHEGPAQEKAEKNAEAGGGS